MGKPRDLANVVATGNILADGAVAPAELTGVTSTAAEINILDGVTATAAELNLLDGVTATTAELNHVDGVTSNVQTQMDTKAPVADPTFTGTVTGPTINASTALQIGGTAITATAAELNKMDGVTVSASDINSVTAKAPIDGATFTGTTTIPTADINGGAIDGAVIGANSAAAVTATTVNASTKLQVNGTDVITNSRQLANIASVDSTTVAALSAAGVGSANSFDATISGSVADGKPMVLNTNGTVAAVAESVSPLDPPQDQHHVDIDQQVYSHAIAYHPVHQRSLICYRAVGNSNYVTFRVLDTGDGTAAMTVGSPTIISSSYGCYEVDLAYDPNTENFVACWRGDNNQGYAVAVSINSTGDSVAFGAVQNFTGSSVSSVHVACGGPSSNNFGNAVIFWRDNSNPNYGQCILYNVEANKSMTQRTSTTINSGATLECGIGYDPDTDRFLAVWRDNGNNEYGNSKVIEVSNNTGVNNSTLTTGNEVTFDSNTSDYNQVVYDTNANKIVVLWRREHGGGTGNNRWYARVGTITGGGTNSITYGTAVEIDSTNAGGGSRGLASTFDSDSNNIVVIYKIGTSDIPRARVGTVSGTSISFSGQIDTDVSLSANTAELAKSITYDSNTKGTIYAYRKSAGLQYGTAGKLKTQTVTTNLTASNYIGIADAAYTDGQTATVQTMGAIDDAQSGLTIGSKHYVQTDGTIGTSAGSPSVEAGLAVSATKLLVKG